MTDIDPVSVTFVRAVRPNSSEWFRSARDRLRVQNGDASAHLRFRLDVPDGWVHVSSTLRATAEDAVVGELYSRSVDPDQPNAYRNMTWNNRPANIAGSVAVTAAVGGSRSRALTWDVTADVSEAIAANRGRIAFWISSSVTNRQWLNTSSVSLTLTLRRATAAPVDVAPAGTVGTAKPVFTWTANYAITKVQVQVDELADFASPVYDSGELVSTTPRVDTATQGPVWAGLTGTMQARVRHFTTEWSAWEDVTLTYDAPTSYTVSNPGTTTADPTPPDMWTPAAEAVEIITYLDGVKQGTTGIIAGPITTYTPKQNAKKAGQVLKRVRHLYDGVARVQPAYSTVVTETTFVPTATVAGLSSLSVTQLGELPAMQVAWTRDSGVPDEVGIYRDRNSNGTFAEAELVAQPNGPDGSWIDWLLPPNTEVAYGARAVVNGEHSDAVLTQRVRNGVTGVWLVDPYSGDGFESGDLADVRGVRLRGRGIEVAYGDVSVVHTPIDGATLLRRTLTLRGPEGSISGQITEWPGREDEQQKADVEWLRQRPERTLRLIMGDLNIPVVCSSLQAVFDAETSFVDRMRWNVSFTFSHAGGV